MKIQLLTITLTLILLSLATIQAQEIATQEDIELAGITPAQPIRWRIELFFNRITETFSENARIEHAKERLAEAKVMMEQNQYQYAEKAMNRFQNSYMRTKNKTSLLDDKELVENLGQKIKGIATQGGNLTQERIREIEQLVEQHRENIKQQIQEKMKGGLLN